MAKSTAGASCVIAAHTYRPLSWPMRPQTYFLEQAWESFESVESLDCVEFISLAAQVRLIQVHLGLVAQVRLINSAASTRKTNQGARATRLTDPCRCSWCRTCREIVLACGLTSRQITNAQGVFTFKTTTYTAGFSSLLLAEIAAG